MTAVEGIGAALGRPIVRAAIYCRISKDQAGNLLGVKRQEPICRKICDGLGWTVVAVYVDDDTSAHSGERRKDYERMKADIAAGLIDALVVMKVNRLTRDNEKTNDATDFLRFAKKHDLKFASDGGQIILKTAAGKKRFMSEAIEAEFGSDEKGELLQEKHKELARAGKWSGGSIGYGWAGEPFLRPDRTTGLRFTGKLDPKEAGHLQEAFQRILDGETASKIARDWNVRGIKTKKGSNFTHSDITRTLLQPRLAGLRTYRGEIQLDDEGESIRGEWEPVVDLATWEKARTLLAPDPARRWGSNGYARVHLLSGLAFCGECETKMTANPSNGAYNCSSGSPYFGCGRVARSIERVERLIRQAVFYVFDHRAFQDALPSGDSDDRLDKLRTDRQQREMDLVKHRNALTDGIIEPEDFAHVKQRIKADLDEFDRQIATEQQNATKRRKPVREGGRALRAAWETGNLQDRREIVEEAIERIYIYKVDPGGTGRAPFDPSKIKVVWQDRVELPKIEVWQRQAQSPPPELPHGLSRHRKGCRCEICTTAYLEYQREYRERPGNREKARECSRRWRQAHPE